MHFYVPTTFALSIFILKLGMYVLTVMFPLSSCLPECAFDAALSIFVQLYSQRTKQSEYVVDTVVHEEVNVGGGRGCVSFPV